MESDAAFLIECVFGHTAAGNSGARSLEPQRHFFYSPLREKQGIFFVSLKLAGNSAPAQDCGHLCVCMLP